MGPSNGPDGQGGQDNGGPIKVKEVMMVEEKALMVGEAAVKVVAANKVPGPGGGPGGGGGQGQGGQGSPEGPGPGQGQGPDGGR